LRQFWESCGAAVTALNNPGTVVQASKKIYKKSATAWSFESVFWKLCTATVTAFTFERSCKSFVMIVTQL
jgi:hypothetical protein